MSLVMNRWLSASGLLMLALVLMLLTARSGPAFAAHIPSQAFAGIVISPDDQTCDVGVPCDVDVVVEGGTVWHPGGIQTVISFDASLLEVTNVAPGGPWTTTVSSVDNVNGTVTYDTADAGPVFRGVVATITFNPLAAGVSDVTFNFVRLWINSQWFSHSTHHPGSIEVTGPTGDLFFTEAFEGADEGPNLEDPDDAFTVESGVVRKVTSPGTTARAAQLDRRYLRTSRTEYNTIDWEYTIDVDFASTSDQEIVFIGVGTGERETHTNNEPEEGAYFRIHNQEIAGGLVHVATRTNNGPYIVLDQLTSLPSDAPFTVRIKKVGTQLSFEIVGVTVVHDITFPTFLSNTTSRLFFGNSEVNNTKYDNMVVVEVVADATPPVVTPPSDVTVEATGPQTAVSIGTATATDDVGVVSITSDAPATYPVGTTEVTWTATDAAGNEGTATQDVTVEDTTAPVVSPPSDVTVEATGPQTAVSIGTATATDDVGVVSITSDAPATYPVGTTEVTWTATDPAGNEGTATQDVTIEDTTAPTISVSVSPEMVWPPNHKMVDISATVTASDIADPSPTVVLTSVVSNEPDNGKGDGNTVDDVQGAEVGTADYDFQVRAERSGKGGGRVYTITYTVTDASGNSASGSATVTVPHSKGKKK